MDTSTVGSTDSKLQRLKQNQQALAATLNLLPTAMWFVREDAYVYFANTAAWDLVRAGRWVRQRSGQLHTIGHLDADSVQQCIQHAAVTGGHHKRLFIVSIIKNNHALRGTLRSIPISGAVLCASAWPKARALLTLEIASAPKSEESLWLKHLAERFALTQAQCEILSDLGHGYNAEEIAMGRGIKVGTVRAHLHELLSKTRQVSQSGLVRLASGS